MRVPPEHNRMIWWVVNEADKLRSRVGGSRGAFDEEPLPEKPKRMRWATYNRFKVRYDRLVGAYETEFMRRLTQKTPARGADVFRVFAIAGAGIARAQRCGVASVPTHIAYFSGVTSAISWALT